jgi:hypothetical protein
MMISNTYESDNLENIHRQLTIHFSKDEPLKNTKKNIIKICFNDILNKLCFPLQNNDIVLDYRYFKFISSPENYDAIIQHIISVIKNVLKTQESFIFHVNMSSITILHIEKYFGFIKNISEVLKTTFPEKLNVCYIYNAPFIFSKLFAVISAFIDKRTQQKIKLVKDE